MIVLMCAICAEHLSPRRVKRRKKKGKATQSRNASQASQTIAAKLFILLTVKRKTVAVESLASLNRFTTVFPHQHFALYGMQIMEKEGKKVDIKKTNFDH